MNHAQPSVGTPIVILAPKTPINPSLAGSTNRSQLTKEQQQRQQLQSPQFALRDRFAGLISADKNREKKQRCDFDLCKRPFTRTTTSTDYSNYTSDYEDDDDEYDDNDGHIELAHRVCACLVQLLHNFNLNANANEETNKNTVRSQSTDRPVSLRRCDRNRNKVIDNLMTEKTD